MPLPSTMTPIATNTLTANAASFTFSSIPQGYTDLVLVCQPRTNVAATAGSINLQFNGDTGTNYSRTRILGSGSAASSYRETSTTYLASDGASGSSVSEYGVVTFNIMNYSNTTTNKTALWRDSAAASYVAAQVGLWRSTAAITSIKVSADGSNQITSGSTFTLYGVKAA